MATLYYVCGRPVWAAAARIAEAAFTLVSNETPRAIEAELLKQGWSIRKVRMATRDECETLFGYEEAARHFKHEIKRIEEKQRKEKERAAQVELEKQQQLERLRLHNQQQREREAAEQRRQQQQRECERLTQEQNRRRQLEEEIRRKQQRAAEMKEKARKATAAFLIPETVIDAKSRIAVECVIEKAKLLLASENGEGLLDSLCASIVDVRVNLSASPSVVGIADELYARLTELVAGRKRAIDIERSFNAVARNANDAINSIASRTYTCGGEGLGFLFAAIDTDSQVRQDEGEIVRIERQLAQHKRAVEAELQQVGDTNLARAILTRRYILLLSHAVGKSEYPGDISDDDIDRIARGLNW